MGNWSLLAGLLASLCHSGCGCVTQRNDEPARQGWTEVMLVDHTLELVGSKETLKLSFGAEESILPPSLIAIDATAPVLVHYEREDMTRFFIGGWRWRIGNDGTLILIDHTHHKAYNPQMQLTLKSFSEDWITAIRQDEKMNFQRLPTDMSNKSMKKATSCP